MDSGVKNVWVRAWAPSAKMKLMQAAALQKKHVEKESKVQAV